MASPDSHSDSDDQSLLECTWSKLRNASITQGYRDGMTAGQERTLQQGFDDGYKSAFIASQNTSELRGLLSVFLHQASQDQILSAEIHSLITSLSE